MLQKLHGVHLILLVSLVLILASGNSRADGEFYVIAHMVNSPAYADLAFKAGANAVEMDLKFDGGNGRPTVFHHGLPCDCVCPSFSSMTNNICRFGLRPCNVRTNYKTQLEHILRRSRTYNLALIYIDSKITKTNSQYVQRLAGRNVVKAVIEELFDKGYTGKVLIGVADQPTYLGEVAKHAATAKSLKWNNRSYKDRIYVTLDQWKAAYYAIGFMTRLATKNVIYSNGISVCSPKTFYKEIALAEYNKERGVLSSVFVWTLDKSKSMNEYLNLGVNGILTNNPRALVSVAKARRLKLATPSSTLPARTSNRVVGSLSCDCNYAPGGCRIVRQAPAGRACKCIYRGYWTCKGIVVRCANRRNGNCVRPNKGIHACLQGRGDCEGYKTAKCDCDYVHKKGRWGIRKASGCKIVKKALPHTACKCKYGPLWTCRGDLVRCANQHSRYCSNPDNSRNSCNLGRGDCKGY